MTGVRHVLLPLLLLMTGAAPAPVLLGDWGGDRTLLTISAAGATLRQDCAEGRFGPVRLDPRGAFATDGAYHAHGPGPQSGDAMEKDQARYEGKVAGDTLRLVIRPWGAPPQTLTLIRGHGQKLIRCY
jgi:hypothetical protein